MEQLINTWRGPRGRYVTYTASGFLDFAPEVEGNLLEIERDIESSRPWPQHDNPMHAVLGYKPDIEGHLADGSGKYCWFCRAGTVASTRRSELEARCDHDEVMQPILIEAGRFI